CIAVTLIVGQPIALCRLSGVVGVYGRPRAWRATKGDRLSLPLQRDDGLRLGGAAFADRADLFRCLELDADAVELDSERMRDPFADRAAVVLQLRALEDDGGIDVDDRVAELERKLFRVAQEDERIASFPARVGIGEMHADIAEGGGAENGIGDGVGQHVGVGVSGEPGFIGDGEAAETEGSAGFEAGGDEAEAGADCRHWAVQGGGPPGPGGSPWTRRLEPARGPTADEGVRPTTSLVFLAIEQVREFHVGGLGDLDIAIAA